MIKHMPPRILTEEELEEYEKNKHSLVFAPFVQRVAVATIGQDLVSVQPLEAPSGNLFYFDYEYKPKKRKKWSKPSF